MHEKSNLDTPADQRSAFAAEIAAFVNKHRDAGRAQTVTNTGHTVLVTDMWGDHVGAVDITDPDGYRVRRADGWEIGTTEEIAAFLWDELEWTRVRAVKRGQLAGLKSVRITSCDTTGRTPSQTTNQYHLTPEQLAQVHALAERLAAANAAE
ncbi:hypothetical protein [Streptomyces sp. NRRL F-5053]|uniref:hypothetical protein n=1 Tax=Streptomyces sp. NRRL F-5053 TaxID=1463854 RepID=UPI000AB279A4|nr:hypothetical protein [Streptomyces sp. NRRL F-5053]